MNNCAVILEGETECSEHVNYLKSIYTFNTIPTKIQPNAWMDVKDILSSTRTRGCIVQTLPRSNLQSNKQNYIYSYRKRYLDQQKTQK